MKNMILQGFWPLLLLLAGEISAQDRPESFCGTVQGRSEWLVEYQRNPQALARTTEITYLPLQVHLVARSDGSDVVETSRVIDALCLVNEDFASANIQFFIEGIRVLSNSTIYEHSNWIPTLLREQNVAGRINCYFVNNPNNTCGYMDFIADALVMDIFCTSGSSHTWSHELGHFLSLPHTFQGWEQVEDPDYSRPAPKTVNYYGLDIPVEKADGSNCAVAGDGFCDTEADYLNDGWACLSDSTSEQVQLDPDSVAFRSQGAYIMAYSWDQCQSIFTPEQQAAMKANILGPRAELISNPSPEVLAAPDLSQLILLEPANGSVPPFFDSVRLTWTPLEGALMYTVQLNIINNFSQGAALEFKTSDTTLLIEEGLAMNRRYHWRVSPVMPYFACNNDFTSTRNFRTSTTSPVIDPLLSGALNIYPNPVSNGLLTLELNDASLRGSLDYQLLDGLGKMVLQGMIPNSETTRLDLRGLPPGVYFLRARADGRFTTKKIVVN